MHCRPVADDLSDVGGAIVWVGQQIAGANLGDDTLNNIEVCVEEVLANLIQHSQPARGAKDIAIGVASDRDGATVVVSDRCVPFDSTSAPLSSAPAGGTLQIGGRGLRLIRAFASELAYRSCEGRNQLTMRFGPPA